MKIFLLLFFQFFLTCFGDKIVELIKASKYPVEVHHVQTSDGFKLRLHRIPTGVRHLNYDVTTGSEEIAQNETFGEPVFLMHGLVCSAAMWISMSPEKSLGYMLADAGYDVWMLSARGTSYSASHKSLDSKSKKYWDFSWHEIGYYDVPAAIDYVLSKTKQKQVKYVGHSQGCTVFAVALSKHPNLNGKISSAVLLAPAVFLHHTTSLVKNFISNYKELQEIADFLRIYGVQVRSPMAKRLNDMMCHDGKSTNVFCKEMMFQVVGKDSGQLEVGTYLSMMVNDVMDDVSLKQLAHFAQVSHNGRFAMFDYGSAENQVRYNSHKPPEYNLTRIQVPTTIFYGTNDALVNPIDVELFISKLPNVRESVKLPWNHLDFVFGQDIDVKVNDFIIRRLREKGTEKKTCETSEPANFCTST